MGNSVYVSGRTPVGVSPPRDRMIPGDIGAVAKVGVLLLCVYIFVIYSRTLEIFGIGTVTAILLALLIPCIVLSGNLFQFVNDRVGRLLMAYGAWFCLAVATSTWRGGSIDILTHRTGRALLLYVAIVVLISTKRDFMRLVWAIALGNLFLVVRALLAGAQQEGRLVVPGGTFGDPNDLAMYAIFGMFLWWLIALRLPLVLRFVPLIAAALALLAFGKAGSRGGLVALVIAGVAHFWNSSFTTKLRVAAATVVVLLMAVFLLPDYLRARFTTFFSVDSDSEYAARLEGNDVGSTLSRQELAGQAFSFTLRHPLFGVGPGEFGNLAYNQQTTGQRRFVNHATHNSYLQISSETGFPGALLFIAALAACLFKKPKYAAASGKANPPRAGPSSARAGGKPNSEYAVIIHYARVTLIFVAAFALTLSFAYDDIFMLAMGLMTAAINVADRENTWAAVEPSRSGQTAVVVRR